MFSHIVLTLYISLLLKGSSRLMQIFMSHFSVSVLWKWFSCGTLANDMFWGFWQNINSMVRDGMSKLYIKSTLTKCLLLASYFRNVIALWNIKYVVYSILVFLTLAIWPSQLLSLRNPELTERSSLMTRQIIMLALHSLEFKPQGEFL